MKPLGVVALTAAGWGRAALIAGSTALVSGLVLVAVSMSRLNGPRDSSLMATLADPGTRGGTVFGVVVLTLPVVALFNQGVRLGTAARLRRYHALTVAGVTLRELRGWAAVEVGGPAAVGAVLGIGVWWVLRELLGRALVGTGFGAIVPPHTGPGAWTFVVVIGLACVGVVVGFWSARPSRAPRAARFPVWAMGSFVLGVFWFVQSAGMASDFQALLALVPIVAGVTGLAPWLTGITARVAAARTRSSTLLLAARRLSLDPRPAARAGLAAGAGGLVLGVLGGFVGSLASDSEDGYAPTAGEHYQAAALVAVLVAVGFLFIGVALAVHIADRVVAERRAYAALGAIGFTSQALLAALRWEALIATLPVAVLGCGLGIVGYALPVGGTEWARWSAAATAATVLGVVGATFASSALVASVVRSATTTGALRTE